MLEIAGGILIALLVLCLLWVAVAVLAPIVYMAGCLPAIFRESRRKEQLRQLREASRKERIRRLSKASSAVVTSVEVRTSPPKVPLGD